MFSDLTLILLFIAIALSLYAQYKVNSTFKKYLKVPSMKGVTGAQAAQMILDKNELQGVRLEMTAGKLTDHYDSRNKIVRLSSDVYNGTSIASLGVAAHEVGHAVQHNDGYFPLEIRNAFVPVAQLGSTISFPLILIGFIMGSMGMVTAGIYLFTAVVIFQIITLPVEFNASSRAVADLQGYGFISNNERKEVKKVLDAAALTYVAAVAVSLLNLVRLIIISRE